MKFSSLKSRSVFFVAASVFFVGNPVAMAFETQEENVNRSSSMGRISLPALQQKVMAQDERIEGLTTIIEGLSATLNTLQREHLNARENENNSSDVLLKKLTVMIDDINRNYVSKEELKTFLSKLDKQKTSTVAIKKKKEKKVLNPTQEKSAATLYSEGVRHFVKQRYNEARKRFSITLKEKYKPAASNYYLGEIAYYTKQYDDAIFHYKQSAGLYDKASYMDTLLLHTAISLDKTGKKDQAKVFYENIIETYPDKKTAKIARNRVERL